jgi:hypothetical protein
LARTGSKSTNHDLKSARAISSSVSFIRRFSAILSSSVPRMWAMARCSESGGIRSSRFRHVGASQAVENCTHVEELRNLLPPFRTADKPAKKRWVDLGPVGPEQDEILAQREL